MKNRVIVTNSLGRMGEFNNWLENRSSERELFPWILASIIFSLPLETLLPHYFNTRSHVYYLSILALLFSILHLNQIVRNFKRSKGLTLIILSFAWAILIYFLNPSSVSNDEYILIVQLVLLCFLLLYVADKQVWRTRLIRLYWAGWVILCILSIQFYLTGNVYIYNYSELDIERVVDVLSFSAAQHGAQIATGLMVAIILTFQERRRRQKAIYLSSVVLGIVIVLMTNSRTAIVSLIFTLILYFFIEFGQKKSRFIQRNLFTIVIISLGVFLVFTQTTFGEKLFNSFLVRINLTVQTGDTTGRVDIIKAGLELAKKNLITGIGYGNSQPAIGPYLQFHPEGVDMHNFYVRMLVEGGLISFFFFLGGVSMLLRQGWWWYRYSGQSIYFYPLLLLLIIAMGGRPFLYKIMWFFLAFNMLTPAIDYGNKWVGNMKIPR